MQKKKKKVTLNEILVTLVKIIGCLISNIIIHGIIVIIMMLPVVDYVDGYFNPSLGVKILVLIFELVMLITQIDLILMTIHSVLEGVLERYMPNFCIGVPWNYLLKTFTADLWFGEVQGGGSSNAR